MAASAAVFDGTELLEVGESRATSPFGVAVFLPCGVAARVDAALWLLGHRLPPFPGVLDRPDVEWLDVDRDSSGVHAFSRPRQDSYGLKLVFVDSLADVGTAGDDFSRDCSVVFDDLLLDVLSKELSNLLDGGSAPI